MASSVVRDSRPFLEEGNLAHTPQTFLPVLRKQYEGLTFNEAFDVWIANRTMTSQNDRFSAARYISERTEWDYRQYARALAKMFGDLPMSEIHAGHLREYHRARAFCDGSKLKGANWHKQAGANRIRKEVGMLIRIMKMAGLWTDELDLVFEPLAIEASDLERPLSIDEQRKFLAVAASRPEWSLILHYTIAALQTCCSTNELRSLRMGDVSFDHATITIRTEGAKNKFRARTIPLESPEVIWAFERLVERAQEMGCRSPSHYLFPFRASVGRFDVNRPMSSSGLKKKWDEVRLAADLKWLRPYDLRHTAITRLAEAGVPVSTMMSMAGHVSVKMQQHYTSISMMAKRKAVASAWGGGEPSPRPLLRDTMPIRTREPRDKREATEEKRSRPHPLETRANRLHRYKVRNGKPRTFR